MKRYYTHSRTAGFTIVELMVATLVFMVILLIITIGVIVFSSAYYKGVNSSTTQNTARSIVDDISQAIQFSGQGVTPTTATTNYFCAGDKVYMYTRGTQLPTTPGSTNWGLYRGTNTAISGCTPLASATANGAELLGPHMRLADISVTGVSGQPQLYVVTLRLAYGDSDLLCSPSLGGAATGGCQKTSPSYSPTTPWFAPDMICKSQTGSQFCAVSGLSTTVLQRLKPR
jgi:type II secretory pathway pseudopilin PulG